MYWMSIRLTRLVTVYVLYNNIVSVISRTKDPTPCILLT